MGEVSIEVPTPATKNSHVAVRLKIAKYLLLIVISVSVISIPQWISDKELSNRENKTIATILSYEPEKHGSYSYQFSVGNVKYQGRDVSRAKLYIGQSV